MVQGVFYWSPQFQYQKENHQAALVTVAVIGCLAVLFLVLKWGAVEKPRYICYFKKRYYVNNALSNVNVLTLLGLEISQIVKILIGSFAPLLINGQSGKDALDQSSNALTIM